MRAGRFVKRPVTIEAARFPTFGPDNMAPAAAFDAWLAAHQGDRPCRFANGSMIIQTLEGDLFAKPGDWIIQGIKGELYPCSDEIFRETYDAAESEPLELTDDDMKAFEPSPRPALALAQSLGVDHDDVFTAKDIATQMAEAVADMHPQPVTCGEHAERQSLLFRNDLLYTAPEKLHVRMAAFILGHPDAPLEAVVIHMQRLGETITPFADLRAADLAALECFKLTLITLQAKRAAMQPMEEARAVLGYAEPAEILADQPGDLTDQAVR